jgi:hypothetical protein
MNKRFQITAIAVVLMAAASSSFAADQGTFFINGNLGESSYNSGTATNNTASSSAIRAGYTWYNDTWNFGVEAGYVDLGSIHGPVNIDGISVRATDQAKGPLAGLNLKYKFENKWYISGRAGYLHSTLKASVSGYGSQSISGNGGYAGLGVGYDITPHFSLGLDYDLYRARARGDGLQFRGYIGVTSAFAEYRF